MGARHGTGEHLKWAENQILQHIPFIMIFNNIEFLTSHFPDETNSDKTAVASYVYLRAMAKEGGQAIQRKQGRATHTGAYNENRGVQPKTREHKQGRTTQTGAYNANWGVQPKQGNANRGVQRKQGRTTQTRAYSAKQKLHMYVV